MYTLLKWSITAETWNWRHVCAVIASRDRSSLHTDTSWQTPNAHRTILCYMLSLARIETQSQSGAQSSGPTRNQEPGWTLGPAGMPWLKSRHFAFVSVPFRWWWCIFMQYGFNFGNWRQISSNLLFFSFSSYFPLYWAPPFYHYPASLPLPQSGPGWFLGVFKPRHTWSMRKLMFQKSFFFFFGFWPFCALEIAFNISLLQVFHLISWTFFPLEKNL